MARRARTIVVVGLALAALGAWIGSTRDDDAALDGDASAGRPIWASDPPLDPTLGTSSSTALEASPTKPPEPDSGRTTGPKPPADARARVRVHVVDEDGKPISMSRVTIGGRFTQTELKDGTYDVDRPTDGTALTLSGSAVGYFPSEPVTVAPEDPGPVRISLRRGLDLGGRVVLEDGTPFPDGVSVWIDGPGRSRVVAWMRDNAFRFDAVDEGTHRVVVGLGAHRPDRFLEEPIASGTLDAVIRVTAERLRAAKLLIVHVVDSEGRPVPQASVQMLGAGVSGSGPGHAFVLRMPGDGWVAAGNARDDQNRPLPLAPGLAEFPAGATSVVVRLGSERTISGRVVDPGGAPVANVKVAAHLRTPRDVADPSYARMQGLAQATQLTGTAISGPDGSFVIGQLGDYSYAVAAAPPPGWTFDEPVLTRGGEDGVLLRVVPAARATITVVDPTGRPVAGARVGADAGAVGRGWLTAEPTDAQGRTWIAGAVPGVRYVLIAHDHDPPRFLPARQEEWTGGDTTLRLRAALSIEGIVVDEDGQPPGEAWVTVRPASDPHVIRPLSDPGARPSPDGRFRILSVEPGEYELSAQLVDDGYHFGDAEPRARVVSAGDADVRVVIPVKPVLSVRVDPPPASGANVEVRLFPDEGAHGGRTVSVGPDGFARVRRCRTDTTYTVWLPPTAQGYGLARGVRAPGRVDVRREHGRSIVVNVGGDVIDRTPYVHASSGPITAEGKALPDGTFELADLPPGRWTVTATVSDALDSTRKASAEAEPGSTVTIEIPSRPR